jgi:hypothetical protein
MRSLFILLCPSLALASHAFCPRGDNATVIVNPTSPTETITATTVTTITTCPASTKCHGKLPSSSIPSSPSCYPQVNFCSGQTLTWTGTAGPQPCAASITCTCVLPTAPPISTTCPGTALCTGQYTTWVGVGGPTSCKSICTVELPASGTGNGNTVAAPTTTAASGGGSHVGIGNGVAALVAGAMVLL